MPVHDSPKVGRASAAQTTSTQTAAIACENARNLNVLVDCTAASGTTPSLVVSVEWSHDGTSWFAADPADVMTAITAASKRVKSFAVKAPQARIVQTITGTTPSLTYEVRTFLN